MILITAIGLVFGALSVWEEKIILGRIVLTCCDLPEALKKIVKCLMSVWKSDHVPICVLVSFSKISLFVCLFVFFRSNV